MRDSENRAPRLRTFALVLASVLLAGGLGEVVLRALDRDYNPSTQWHFDPALGWVQNPGHGYTYTVAGEEVKVAYNSAGFRDREHALSKHPRVKRAVVIGDSFSAAVEVNLRDTFGRRLERMLNARTRDVWEVINLGVGDFGTAQQYLALEHYGLAYEPDLVLHQIFPLNDICNNSIDLAGLCKSRKDDYRPYFVASGEELQATSTQPLRSFLRRHLVLFRLAEQALLRWRGHEESHIEEAEYNRLVSEAGLPELVPLLYTYVADEQQIEPVARGWQVTELLIERIATRCKELDITYVPIVVPFHARVNAIWAQFATTQPPPPMIQDYPEQRFGALFERLRVSGVLMRDIFEEHQETLLPPRGGHLNPEAHHLLARAIYDQLLTDGLLDEDPDMLHRLAIEPPSQIESQPGNSTSNHGEDGG